MTTVTRLACTAALAAAAGACDGDGQPPSKRQAELTAAYDRGLDFLAGKAENGVFGVRNVPHVGVTGFCILPFLERPGGMRERDRPLVDKTLAYLAESVGPEGDVWSGLTTVYSTSVAIMAFAASRRPEYAPATERARRYLVRCQHADPADPFFGGTGCTHEDPRADLAITCYALEALVAAGVPPDDPVHARAVVYLQRCQNRKANETPGEPRQWIHEQGRKVVRGDDGGACGAPGVSKAGFDETSGGALEPRSYGSMTCALLHGYVLAGAGAADPRAKAAVDWITERWAVDRNPGMPDEFPVKTRKDALFFYWAALAKGLSAARIDALRARDGRAVDWRSELATALLASQKENGSWQSTSNLWMESVSVVATAYALRALGQCVR